MTDLFTPKKDSSRGITNVIDNEIQARSESRIISHYSSRKEQRNPSSCKKKCSYTVCTEEINLLFVSFLTKSALERLALYACLSWCISIMVHFYNAHMFSMEIFKDYRNQKSNLQFTPLV